MSHEEVLETVTTRVTVAELFLLMLPSEHVTVLVPEQLPGDAVAETKVMPDGGVSVTVTPCAFAAALSVTVIVYVTLLPDATGPAVPVFVSDRSTLAPATYVGGVGAGVGLGVGAGAGAVATVVSALFTLMRPKGCPAIGSVAPRI